MNKKIALLIIVAVYIYLMIKVSFTLYLKNTAMFYGYLALLLIEILLMIRLKKLFFEELTIVTLRRSGLARLRHVSCYSSDTRLVWVEKFSRYQEQGFAAKVISKQDTRETMVGLRSKSMTGKTRGLTP